MEEENILNRIDSNQNALDNAIKQYIDIENEVKFRRSIRKHGIYIDDPRSVHIAEDLNSIRYYGQLSGSYARDKKRFRDSLTILKKLLEDID